MVRPQFFDLLPLAIYDRPLLELVRFAIDPLHGNLWGNFDVFVRPGALSRSWSIKKMYRFCLGAVHLKASARPRIERPFAIFIATTMSRRPVGAPFFMAVILCLRHWTPPSVAV
jgi:hypothetical protein